MKLEHVQAEVERIRQAAGDDEAAHGMGDALHQGPVTAKVCEMTMSRDGRCAGPVASW